MAPAPTPKTFPTAQIGLIVATVTVVLVLGLAWLFAKGKRTAEVRWANDRVAKRVQAAQNLLADRKWDKAIDHLQAALAIDKATALDQAHQLLAQAQQAQAESVLEAGAAALEKGNVGQAIQLLQTYLVHPQATNKPRAALLLVETGRRDKADEIGRTEQQRQADDRQRNKAKEEHFALMQATPVFRELQDFAALTRQQVKRVRELLEKEDQQLLASLLKGQKGKNGSQPDLVQGALRQRQDGKETARLVTSWKDTLEERISVKRANFKERFRTYQEFEKADRQPFDRLVDQELDELLEEIHKSYEDNVAEGLRALTGK
jgi:hypothetical protein